MDDDSNRQRVSDSEGDAEPQTGERQPDESTMRGVIAELVEADKKKRTALRIVPPTGTALLRRDEMLNR